MTNYTKSTDFAVKDVLLTGNPNKLVKGSEVDVEFSNMELADATNVKKTGTTGSAVMPVGTTAQRDASPAVGYTRVNTTSGTLEWWDGTIWTSANGGDAYDLEVTTATAGQTVITTASSFVVGSHTLMVYLNGLLVNKTSDYTETTTNSFTFNTGLTAGDEVVAQIWRTNIATSGDALTVSYTPAGTGAVATTVQSKLRESVSVKDFGADPANSAATNKIDFDNALASTSTKVTVPSGTFASDAITTPAGSILEGTASTSSLTALLTLGSGSALKNITLNEAGNIPLKISSGADGVVIDGVSASTTNYATTFDLSGTVSLTVKNSILSSTGYALLTNTPVAASASSKVRIQDNSLTSADADAIELNHPTGTVTGAIATGNFLSTTSSSVATTAGFAYGNAKTKQWVFNNNVVLDSRLEAIHIEDEQRWGTAVGNSVVSRAHGVLAYPALSGLLGGTFPILGNNFYAPAKVTVPGGITNAGIFLSYASPYSPINGMPVIGNVVEGFTKGIHLRPTLTAVPNVVMATHNSLIGNTDGVHVEGTSNAFNRQFGTNYISGATNLVYASGQGWAVGKVVSEAQPTAIIANGGYGGFMPTMLDGFAYPIASTTTNAGINTSILLAPLTANNRLFGRIKYNGRRSGVADWVYASATILWDGTTLTVTNLLSRYGNVSSGAITGITFAQGGSGLYFQLTTPNATQYTYGWTEFDGEYYDA